MRSMYETYKSLMTNEWASIVRIAAAYMDQVASLLESYTRDDRLPNCQSKHIHSDSVQRPTHHRHSMDSHTFTCTWSTPISDLFQHQHCGALAISYSLLQLQAGDPWMQHGHVLALHAHALWTPLLEMCPSHTPRWECSWAGPYCDAHSCLEGCCPSCQPGCSRCALQTAAYGCAQSHAFDWERIGVAGRLSEGAATCCQAHSWLQAAVKPLSDAVKPPAALQRSQMLALLHDY